MQSTVWALLEPAGMKATLRRWLVQNPRSGRITGIDAATAIGDVLDLPGFRDNPA